MGRPYNKLANNLAGGMKSSVRVFDEAGLDVKPSPGADIIVESVIDHHNQDRHISWSTYWRPGYRRDVPTHQPYELKTPADQDLDELSRWLAPATHYYGFGVTLVDSRLAAKSNRASDAAKAKIDRLVRDGTAEFMIYAWGEGQAIGTAPERRATELRDLVIGFDKPMIELELVPLTTDILDLAESLGNDALYAEQGIVVPTY